MVANSNSSAPDAFTPRRYLRNGHLMTLAGNFLRRENPLPPPEECLFRVADNAQVLCHCHWQPGAEQRDTIVLVHGLEGSSSSQYVIGTSAKAWAAGMNIVRMNMRTCGGTETLTPTLYHSGLSGDVEAVVRCVVRLGKVRGIALVGYSMGGNLVLKLAGELDTASLPQLRAIAAISPAADLAASADAMHAWSNRVYEWKFLFSLMRRFRRKTALFPEVYKKVARWPVSIREFDEMITAPYCGFSGADDYYHRASAARVIHQIAVPTLVVHAVDDPFIRLLPETKQKMLANPHIKLIETTHGGHCAFLEQPNGHDGRWAERQTVDFTREHLVSGRI